MNPVYAAIVLAAIGLVAVTVSMSGTPETQENGDTESAEAAAYNVTDDGRKYTVHPSKLVQGCPGMDCIPSIDSPSFQRAEEAAWLDDRDLVIGLELGGEAKAYPFRILNVHEIVNDRIAGTPVAVTYCPLCRSGLVYRRIVDGEPTEFGVSGKLYNANLVMYDRRTETYWSQIEGEAIVGPQVPAELDLVSSVITTWGEWRDSHPGTVVLSRKTGIYSPRRYGSNPYTSFQRSDRVGFGVDDVDDRLHAKELVYGVAAGNASTAYIEDDIRQVDVINDRVGGLPVLVVEDQESGGIRVFDRTVDGTGMTFAMEGGELVDENGDRWSFTGEAQEGPHRGEQLEQLNSHGFFWFAWSSFHPETSIYGRGAGDG
ncbi:MAG: DUF3179 domain-containing protein [Candidatus Nanohaloarchaea archaeon]|nr:DUF3179 domain-containing protein [Candidatus Nanohaloarchaea archaeon]